MMIDCYLCTNIGVNQFYLIYFYNSLHRTYDSVEFITGAHLNVIIGPNGTGKSTIVCAIYLGLAGKISLLGRAHQPSEYIKFGCNKGKIELEL